MKFRTILIDPPWEQPMRGKRKRKKEPNLPPSLSYPTLSMQQILSLPVGELAEPGTHIWLWTTNAFLREGFDCMQSWGFKYLAPITWHKPSGTGNYFVHVTQTLLFGYYQKCQFNLERYLPTWFDALPGKRHSEKPPKSYEIIERVSEPERIELFARDKRDGWNVWGNEVISDIEFNSPSSHIK
jgi:N6-adenosine-specific RNA methylase IME4